MNKLADLLVFVALVCGCNKVQVDHFEYCASDSSSFAWTNPIVPQRADPHVFLHNGWYYLAATVPEFDRIELRRARSLGGLGTAEPKVVWHRPESGLMSGRIWAPEIHFIDGKWYLYFSGGLRGGRWFPHPIKLGALLRWLKSDIDQWMAAGCPACGKKNARRSR